MSRHPKGCGVRQSTRKPRLGGGIGYTDVLVDGVVMCRCNVCERVVPVVRWPLHGSSEDPHAGSVPTAVQ